MNEMTALAPERGSRPMSTSRLVGAYWAEIRTETLRALREPSFVLPLLLFPGVFYVMFAVVMSFGPPGLMSRYLLASYSAFGIMGTGLFGFGVAVAIERDGGLLTLKRALPMPPAAYLLGKMVMAMLMAMLVVGELLLLGAFLGDVDLSLAQGVGMLAGGCFGVLPFCALGMFVGTVIKGQGAPGFLNLVYLPMAFLSGLWFPLEVMPDTMTRVAVVFPSYHLNQILLRVMGAGNGSIGVALAVLAGCSVVFLALAVWRLRRVG